MNCPVTINEDKCLCASWHSLTGAGQLPARQCPGTVWGLAPARDCFQQPVWMRSLWFGDYEHWAAWMRAMPCCQALAPFAGLPKMWPKKSHRFAVKWSALINHKMAVGAYARHLHKTANTVTACIRREASGRARHIFAPLQPCVEKICVMMASPKPRAIPTGAGWHAKKKCWREQQTCPIRKNWMNLASLVWQNKSWESINLRCLLIHQGGKHQRKKKPHGIQRQPLALVQMCISQPQITSGWKLKVVF